MMYPTKNAKNEMGRALSVDMVESIGDLILPYTNCEENICAYNLENFLGLSYVDGMNANDLQDSGHI